MVQQTQPVAQQSAAQQPIKQPAIAQPNVAAQPLGEGAGIWKKWWLWVIVAVVVIGLIVGIILL